MKKGAKIFVCGPSRKNNMEMKILRKVGVEFGEGSAPFMEDELHNFFKKYLVTLALRLQIPSNFHPRVMFGNIGLVITCLIKKLKINSRNLYQIFLNQIKSLLLLR